jgi:hypothetical protein
VDLERSVRTLLAAHPLVASVELTGSRAEGAAHELSDWDFLVGTDDFARLEPKLPVLLEPLRPLAAQWDRYSHHACFMLLLNGPVKVDLIFPGEHRQWAPPWDVSSETLPAIDRHFWDWILWLTQKSTAGDAEVVGRSLGDLYRLLLAPMGADRQPRSISRALEIYLRRRAELERRFELRLPRELEDEVAPVVRRARRRV